MKLLNTVAFANESSFLKTANFYIMLKFNYTYEFYNA
jgi:hypothetical protein